LTLTPVGGQGSLVYRVSDRILIALDLVPGTPAPVDDDELGHWRDEAVFVANSVLQHLRVAAKSVRVTGIDHLWHPAEGTITISHPFTEAWFVDTDTPLPVFNGVNSTMRVGMVSPPAGPSTSRRCTRVGR
jgi:hypothetical protein